MAAQGTQPWTSISRRQFTNRRHLWWGGSLALWVQGSKKMLFRGRATHARASITVVRRITLRILTPEESSLLPALTIPYSTAR